MFYKVFAIRDLLSVNKHVIMLDTDQTSQVTRVKRDFFTNLPTKLVKQNTTSQPHINYNSSVDTVVYFRDDNPWPKLWNFGVAVIYATESNKRILNKLADDIYKSE